jgi:hypothetical protein
MAVSRSANSPASPLLVSSVPRGASSIVDDFPESWSVSRPHVVTRNDRQVGIRLFDYLDLDAVRRAGAEGQLDFVVRRRRLLGLRFGGGARRSRFFGGGGGGGFFWSWRRTRRGFFRRWRRLQGDISRGWFDGEVGVVVVVVVVLYRISTGFERSVRLTPNASSPSKATIWRSFRCTWMLYSPVCFWS